MGLGLGRCLESCMYIQDIEYIPQALQLGVTMYNCRPCTWGEGRCAWLGGNTGNCLDIVTAIIIIQTNDMIAMCCVLQNPFQWGWGGQLSWTSRLVTRETSVKALFCTCALFMLSKSKCMHAMHAEVGWNRYYSLPMLWECPCYVWNCGNPHCIWWCKPRQEQCCQTCPGCFCCNYPKGYLTRLSESMARRFLSGALQFAYDDPNNDGLVKQLLINAFGGAGMGTEHSPTSIKFYHFRWLAPKSTPWYLLGGATLTPTRSPSVIVAVCYRRIWLSSITAKLR